MSGEEEERGKGDEMEGERERELTIAVLPGRVVDAAELESESRTG